MSDDVPLADEMTQDGPVRPRGRSAGRILVALALVGLVALLFTANQRLTEINETLRDQVACQRAALYVELSRERAARGGESEAIDLASPVTDCLRGSATK